MATAPQHLEHATQKVILQHVSWETYERLLSERDHNPGTRFNYDQGTLEIMIVSLRHERLKHRLSTLIEVIAEELRIDTEGAGSTTFRRRDTRGGFEPDACFYFEHATRMRVQDDVDLDTDPPPELVVEIDITHPSLNKLPIYAALGVPEIWRHDGRSVSIMRLANQHYVESPASKVLPGILEMDLNAWLALSEQETRATWLSTVRTRVRALPSH